MYVVLYGHFKACCLYQFIAHKPISTSTHDIEYHGRRVHIYFMHIGHPLTLSAVLVVMQCL